MRNRRGQLDMAHTLTPNTRKGNLNAALLADNALVLHALVLAAQAIVILDRTEDTGTEQTITLSFERAVVDGLWLFDFTI